MLRGRRPVVVFTSDRTGHSQVYMARLSAPG